MSPELTEDQEFRVNVGIEFGSLFPYNDALEAFGQRGIGPYVNSWRYSLENFTGALPTTSPYLNLGYYAEKFGSNPNKDGLIRLLVPDFPNTAPVQTPLGRVLSRVTNSLKSSDVELHYFWYLIDAKKHSLSFYEVRSLNYFYPRWQDKVDCLAYPKSLTSQMVWRGIDEELKLLGVIL